MGLLSQLFPRNDFHKNYIIKNKNYTPINLSHKAGKSIPAVFAAKGKRL
jgi:hypothetical protein